MRRILLSICFLAVNGVAVAQDTSSRIVTFEHGRLFHQSGHPTIRTGRDLASVYSGQNPGVHFFAENREGLSDLVSVVVEPDARPGVGWYGMFGSMRRSRDREQCDRIYYPWGERYCSSATVVEGSLRGTQVYVGGGVRYRLPLSEKWAAVGMLGVMHTEGQDPQQFPRHHLYHLGVRFEYAFVDAWAVTLGFHHFSNGAQLQLPGGQFPNYGIDRLTLGLQYRF